jgi:hypothetical protein
MEEYVLQSNIDQIPAILSTFNNLKVLKCLGIIYNAENLAGCTTLEALELYGPAMSRLSDIPSLYSLKELTTGDTPQIPINRTLNIYNFTQLVSLLCKNAAIVSTNSIGQHVDGGTLQSIKLRDISVQDSAVIFSQQFLAELKIINEKTYGNWFNSSPLLISNLSQLLSIELVKFGTIPLGIENCSNLTSIKLNNINQREIPAHIFGMIHLREIDFSDCELHDPFVHLTTTNTSIRIVVLDNCFITVISQNVSNLIRLEYISANNNMITSIPDELFEISSLTGILLNNNLISNLTIVSKLNKLELTQNKITKLPHKIYAQVVDIALLDAIVHTNNDLSKYITPGEYVVHIYPSYIIRKIYDMLEYLEPFTMPSGYDDDILYIVLDCNHLVAENVSAKMVFIAFNNAFPDKKDRFIDIIVYQTNPYLAILAAIE